MPQHHDEVIATGRIKVIQMNGSQSEGDHTAGGRICRYYEIAIN